MKRIWIAAGLLLSICMLSGCGGESSVTGTVSLAEPAETTTSAPETTTSAAPEVKETTTAAPTEDSAADTTAAPADITTAAQPASDPETTATSSATEAPAPTSSSTTQTSAQQTSTCLYDELRPGMDMSAYAAAHPVKPASAPSCLGDGEDRTYTYDNLIVYTYYEDGKDTVQEIDITAPGLKTRAGIEVGASADAVAAAYGAPNGTQYVYQTADGTVEFHMSADGGTVTEIALY